ncbi:MAG: SseB family protein [Clostridia bacterium]|nr:SseB family protein [Clostridia bacterium]
MGLFDKFSKKNKAQDEASEEVKETKTEEVKEETAESKAEEAKQEDNTTEEKPKTTRFTVLVESIKELSDGGVIIGGNLSGTVNVGDKVLVVHPSLTESDIMTIDALELIEDDEPGKGESVSFAADHRVGITIKSVKEKNKIPKYSVITNILPQLTPGPKKPIDNPFMLGLTREYARLISDKIFADLFTFTVFSSVYIVPVKLDESVKPNENGVTHLDKGSKIGMILLNHPQDAELKVLPVFTDMGGVSEFKALLAKDPNPVCMALNFEQISEVALKNGGFVINPFGKTPVFVSNQNVEYAQKMKAQMDARIKAMNNSKK